MAACSTTSSSGASAAPPRYDFDDSSADPFDIEDARAYIDEVRWQFAKTMPQWPHEYTVRDWRVDLDDTFLDFVELIREQGVVKPWPADSPTPRYHHTYLAIDGWDYWTMGEPVEEHRRDQPCPPRRDVVLNRSDNDAGLRSARWGGRAYQGWRAGGGRGIS